MLVVELIIVLLAIFLGPDWGIGIGFAARIGVLVLAAIGVKPGNIPFDVISIIMAVIAAISAMQVAGGLDYLVHQTESCCAVTKYITILAPIVTCSPDYLCWYWQHLSGGHCQLSLKLRRNKALNLCRPLSTAVKFPRADCDHRIANRGSGLCLP